LFPHLQEKNGFQTSNLVFFSFSKKIWGFQTKKSKLHYKAVWFCFPFFLTVFATWAELGKTKNNTRCLLKQKKRSCFEVFKSFASLFRVKLS
jgi:hypothetical protein